MMIFIQKTAVLFVDQTGSTMFHPVWVCCWGIRCDVTAQRGV